MRSQNVRLTFHKNRRTEIPNRRITHPILAIFSQLSLSLCLSHSFLPSQHLPIVLNLLTRFSLLYFFKHTSATFPSTEFATFASRIERSGNVGSVAISPTTTTPSRSREQRNGRASRNEDEALLFRGAAGGKGMEGKKERDLYLSSFELIERVFADVVCVIKKLIGELRAFLHGFCLILIGTLGKLLTLLTLLKLKQQ